jgi:hypothetical protein
MACRLFREDERLGVCVLHGNFNITRIISFGALVVPTIYLKDRIVMNMYAYRLCTDAPGASDLLMRLAYQHHT